jgi:hypothetical protein
MGFIENQLELGESVVFKIGRGRKFKDYDGTVFRAFVLFPYFGYLIWKFFSDLFSDFPMPIASDPPMAQFLVPACLSSCMYGPGLMFISLGILDVIHLFTDEIALTNKRIIGRAQSQYIWSFRPIDVRLEDVRDINIKNLSLEIHTNDDRPIRISRLDQQQEFIEKFRQIKQTRWDRQA